MTAACVGGMSCFVFCFVCAQRQGYLEMGTKLFPCPHNFVRAFFGDFFS